MTLGTPHQGIAFQAVRDLGFVDAADELERFNPKEQADADRPVELQALRAALPAASACSPSSGPTTRPTGSRMASLLNRFTSTPHEFGWTYNRSDGLVKQSSAQLPGAPRTFVHKCHGGPDSLVTSREAFEVATRFFHGDVYARLNLISADVKRGFDRFGKSEMFFGVSIKPRRVDFELFHQSAEAENCYGPFRTGDFSDELNEESGLAWAGPDRLIWEGWLDTKRIATRTAPAPPGSRHDLVMRLDVYVGERDSSASASRTT